MKVIKFQDFMDKSYLLEQLPEVSSREKIVETVLMVGAIIVAAKLAPLIALPIAHVVIQGVGR